MIDYFVGGLVTFSCRTTYSWFAGSSRGWFQFEVSDGVSLAGPESFQIVASPLTLRLDVLTRLDAFPGIVQPITANHIRAVTNDPDQVPVAYTRFSFSSYEDNIDQRITIMIEKVIVTPLSTMGHRSIASVFR